jgi:hypothetical protein
MLNRLLWLSIIGLIMSTAMLSLYMGYSGVYSLCAGRLTAGGWAIAAGVGLAIGCGFLTRNGDDLMDR